MLGRSYLFMIPKNIVVDQNRNITKADLKLRFLQLNFISCLCCTHTVVVCTFSPSEIWKGKYRYFLCISYGFLWQFIVSIFTMKSDNVESSVCLENRDGQVCQLPNCKHYHEFKLSLAISGWRSCGLFLLHRARKYLSFLLQKQTKNPKPNQFHIQQHFVINVNQKTFSNLSSAVRKVFFYEPLKFMICLLFWLKKPLSVI